MSEFKAKLDKSSESEDLSRLIDDTDELIASVYELFEQPRRVSPVMTPVVTHLGRSLLHDSNSSSSRFTPSPTIQTSPRTPPRDTHLRSPIATPRTPPRNIHLRTPIATPRTPALLTMPATPQSSSELEAEMSRIDSFCDMLEQNLRSVTADNSGEVVDTRWPAASARSPLPRPTTPIQSRSPRTPQSRKRDQTGITEPVAIIDLCETMYMPSPLCPAVDQSLYQPSWNDDVIIVSPNGVVDLCTPPFDRSNVRAGNANRNRRTGGNSITASSRNRTSIANTVRRRLTPAQRTRADENSTSCDTRSLISTQSATQLPRTASTARCSVSTSTTNIRSNRDKDKEKQVEADTDSNVGANTEERSILCAVCMENPLNNQPTSTKCGHVFCAACINRAIKLTHKCPMCNTKLTTRMLFRIYV